VDIHSACRQEDFNLGDPAQRRMLAVRPRKTSRKPSTFFFACPVRTRACTGVQRPAAVPTYALLGFFFDCFYRPNNNNKRGADVLRAHVIRYLAFFSCFYIFFCFLKLLSSYYYYFIFSLLFCYFTLVIFYFIFIFLCSPIG